MSNQPDRLTCSFVMAPAEMSAEVMADGGRMRIGGYAAKFGVLSEDLGGFRTKIEPTAFDKVLPTADVRLLINHDPNLLMGRTRSGSLHLSVDATGLRFEGTLPETDIARHHFDAIRRGDMDGCSFSCDVDDDDWDWSGDVAIRSIRSVSGLFDVGPVVFPAFPATSVEAARYASETARRTESDRTLAAARRGRRIHVLSLIVSLGP